MLNDGFYQIQMNFLIFSSEAKKKNVGGMTSLLIFIIRSSKNDRFLLTIECNPSKIFDNYASLFSSRMISLFLASILMGGGCEIYFKLHFLYLLQVKID